MRYEVESKSDDADDADDADGDDMARMSPGGIVPGIEPWQNCLKGVVHCEVSCDWQFQLPIPCYSQKDF